MAFYLIFFFEINAIFISPYLILSPGKNRPKKKKTLGKVTTLIFKEKKNSKITKLYYQGPRLLVIINILAQEKVSIANY